tara:strand:- start:1466 stop:2263 length:798 start_codon:yes stop_codon:yes gene_type:complete
MIGAEQIKVNFETFNGVLESSFKGERLKKLKKLTDVLKERMMFSPASSKDWFNNAFPGGYLDHILRVNKIANQLHKLYAFHNANAETYTDEELNFISLFGQLGKLGDWNNEYFIKNDSDWHVKNLGMVYKFNHEVPAMKIYDRTIFLLQDAGIKLSHNEYLAIRAQEGLFDESNKFYFYSGQKETKFRTHLPLLIHQAIQTAQEIEYQTWSSGNQVVQSTKPANASKADKSLRKAKAIKEENNPNFSKNTKSIIDSFFTDDTPTK